MSYVVMGNSAAKASYTDQGLTTTVAVPGNRETHIQLTDLKLSDQFTELVKAWHRDCSDADPVWVECDNAGLVALIQSEWPNIVVERPADWVADSTPFDAVKAAEAKRALGDPGVPSVQVAQLEDQV